MTERKPFAAAVLAQHVAVLGKTGAGKSSTAKLLIEQVVGEGARVCVLDPIKSDWWGLTSSADGRRPGLPFHILGGPRGHVPLHSAAGKAIADVVASGALRLSILDMADFEPGGQAKFFVDFASTLLKRMRGVVYLVLEEAHLFAPKERSGIGAETLAIHWAKMLATAGRSKGVRLVLVTQRTQALHNALLGSCDTLIAHRLTAPADQAPVVAWLKANTSREVLEQVSTSLASLQTGHGWICAGEARQFERVVFPRIATYDNTATPTGDGDVQAVTTAAVDADQLRGLIGAAVAQAQADDPKVLRQRIQALEQQLQAAGRVSEGGAKVVHPPQVVEKPVITDAQLARAEALVGQVDAAIGRAADLVTKPLDKLKAQVSDLAAAVQAVRQPLLPMGRTPIISPPKGGSRKLPAAAPVSGRTDGPTVALGKGERAVLTILAQYPQGRTKTQIAILAGYASSGGRFRNILGAMRSAGYLEGADTLVLTEQGAAALGSWTPLPTGPALLEHWCEQLPASEAKVLRVIADHYPDALHPADLAAATDYEPSGGRFRNILGKLRTLGLIERREIRASALFVQ